MRQQYPQVKTGRSLIRDIYSAFPGRPLDLHECESIPDGYAIYPDRMEVDIFEVEVTHPIPRSSMRDFARLWFALDEWDIRLCLYVVSRYGHINELDFLPAYLGLMELERKERESATCG